MPRRSLSTSSPGLCCPFGSSDSDSDSYEGSKQTPVEEQKQKTKAMRKESCLNRVTRMMRNSRPRTRSPRDGLSDLSAKTTDGTGHPTNGFGRRPREPECIPEYPRPVEPPPFDTFSSVSLGAEKLEDVFETISFKALGAPSSCPSFSYNISSPAPIVPMSQSIQFELKPDRRSAFPWISVSTEEDKAADSQPDNSMEIEKSVAAEKRPVVHTHPDQHVHSPDPGPSRGGTITLPRSLSFPPLSRKTDAKMRKLDQAESLPDVKLNCSGEAFTPGFTDDGETYRFQCSGPGLFQCSVTGLLFLMEGGGEVLYAVVPWNRRLLSQHDKKPAGPLFDIKCVQQSVRQLHLPHCEIPSTGGGHFLSVAHVNEEGVEFIHPHRMTETHVIINITGYSGFGNVKDEDSPPDPVQGLVLLFYRPPDDPDLEHLINVLMLPKNVSLRDVLRTRKKLVADEIYIETSPHCKLQPKQVYSLSTCPGADSVLVQPSQAEFDEESYDNCFPSFQVTYDAVMRHMKLFLRDSSSHSIWERRVCLSTSGVKRSCGSTRANLRPDEQLLDVRSNFIRGVSGPVLQSLLDKLLEKKVMADSEREAAEEMKNRGDKARFVLDTVRKKGEAASAEMTEFLCEVDPFLCEHLGLM